MNYIFGTTTDKQTGKKFDIEIYAYGKSMYGGWYIDFWDKSIRTYNGDRGKTLNELAEKYSFNVKRFGNIDRRDNI